MRFILAEIKQLGRCRVDCTGTDEPGRRFVLDRTHKINPLSKIPRDLRKGTCGIELDRFVIQSGCDVSVETSLQLARIRSGSVVLTS